MYNHNRFNSPISLALALACVSALVTGCVSENSFTQMPKSLSITTISTDFRQMGEMAARQIRDHTHCAEEVPFYLTLRNSL